MCGLGAAVRGVRGKPFLHPRLYETATCLPSVCRTERSWLCVVAATHASAVLTPGLDPPKNGEQTWRDADQSGSGYRVQADIDDRRCQSKDLIMVGIGIVGIGFMGMIHYLAAGKAKGARVVAVCSRDPKKLAGDWTSIQGNFGPRGTQMDLSGVACVRELRRADRGSARRPRRPVRAQRLARDDGDPGPGRRQARPRREADRADVQPTRMPCWRPPRPRGSC